MSWSRRRSDLTITRQERYGRAQWVVYDPVRRTSYWFGEVEHRVLDLLDGVRERGDIAAAIGVSSEEALAALDELVEGFSDAGLLEDGHGRAILAAGAEERKRLERRLLGQLTQRSLSEVIDRFDALELGPTSDCERCELLCCSMRVDLADDEVPGIVAAGRHLGMKTTEVLSGLDRDPGEGPAPSMSLARKVDGSCVMLDGKLCRIHGALGLGRKPRACQLYPGLPMLTPSGPRVGLRAGCVHPGRSESSAPAYKALLRAWVKHSNTLVTVAPDTVLVASSGERMGWPAYEAWMRDSEAIVLGAPTALEGLRLAARELLARAGAPRPGSSPGVAELARFLAQGRYEPPAHRLAHMLSVPLPERRRTPRRKVVTGIDELRPLRGETALAGLAALALLVAATDRDGGKLPDADVAAGWYRAFVHSSVRLALLELGAPTVEALLFDPGL